ncbi:MAG: sulfate permease [Gammaproteobacteria bacterium]|nr:sulfate permease [Gammaproteobacteria bacterium]
MTNYLLDLLRDAGRRFVPFLDWIGDLRNPEILRADIFAGVTVALVLIPQSMANAQLAGLPPEVGLYSAFLIPIVAAIFGSSRQLQNGPVAIISLMSAAALIPLGLSTEEYIAYAAMLALLAGGMQLILGFLRLGILVDFLSHPVIIGFISAAAIVISSLQLGKLFGIENISGEHLYQTLWNLILAIPGQSHLPTVIMGMSSLLMLVLFKKFAPKKPGILITVVVTTLLSWWLGYDQLGGKIVGNVPAGLPSFIIPGIHPEHFAALLLPAFMIAILSFVEAFSIAKAVAAKTRQRLSANQEMVGKGLANVVAGFSQGYAVSGSFSRTAVAFDAGAKTGFTAIVSGLLVGITLLYLTPLLYYIPIATLAAVIIVAVVGMIHFEPFSHAWKVHPHDGLVALTVFIGTLFFAPHLEWGIFIGVGLSIGLYIARTMRPHFAEVAMSEDGTLRDAKLFHLQTSETMALFRYDGDLYFANASHLEKKLLNAIADKPKLKVIILDLEAVDQIDVTGEEMLKHMSEGLKLAGIQFCISRPKFNVMDMLKRSGLVDAIGEEHFFARRHDALTMIKERYGDDVDIDHLLEHEPL